MTRQPVSAQCDIQIWDDARATVRGMVTADPDYSLADLLEAALASEIQRLQATHNNGAPWPPAGQLRPGRRIKSPAGRIRKSRSSQCDEQTWAAARATAHGMLTVDPSYSLADLLEAALASEIQRLQATHNNGVPWPPVAGSLRPGRRIGTDSAGITSAR